MTASGATDETRPVRVVVVVKGLGLGGAERLLVDQVVAGHGPEVRYSVAYVRPDKTHFVAVLEAQGVEVVALRPRGERLWPVGLARALRRLGPDVVHSHSPLPAVVARVLVRLGFAGRPSTHAYTEHNRWGAYRWPTRAANAATMVLDHRRWAVSDEARGSVRPRRLRSGVTTLHHGIDLGLVRQAAGHDPDDPRPPPGEGAFTYVHVANRRPEKAHDVLLDAFARAAAREPRVRLWLVGQGLDDPAFRLLVDRHPARDRIEVLGYRRDAPALLAGADALVLSSDHEGLPVVIMEALAVGLPVVATAVGGIPEAVRDDREAVLVPARDPEALAAAMVALVQDPERRERLAAGAAARAVAFDAGRSQRLLEDAYRELRDR